jgi:hypothetical protein
MASAFAGGMHFTQASPQQSVVVFAAQVAPLLW